MKKKWLIFSIFALLVFAVCLTIGMRGKKSQPRRMKIDGPFFQTSKISQFTKSKAPCINLEIEGRKIESKIDTGSNNYVCLAKEIISEMKNKKLLGVTTILGIRGKTYQTNYFEFSGIRLGNASFNQCNGNEISLDHYKDAAIDPQNSETSDAPIFPPASVGWPFFSPFNLYLDCKESMIANCDSVETLQKNGYLLDCVEAPLIPIGKGIGLVAETDKGPLRCLFDTGCTINFFNSAEEVSIDEAFRNPNNKILVPSLKIGSLDFGTTEFVRVPINLPQEWECDAILGMEFISSKQIFIDFGKAKIYFAVPKEPTEPSIL
jgi:hypothetical protein